MRRLFPSPNCAAADRRRRARRAFTLVEVILAIAIATGILLVALVFYSQTANLRSQLITEAEHLSALRLVMDRLASDLNSAFEQPQIGFNGTADSMEFVVSKAPDLSRPGALSAVPTSDLRRVAYYLTAALEGTNFLVTGLDRTEQSLVTRPPSPKGADAAAEAAPSAGGGAGSTSAPPVSLDATNAVASAVEPLADSIRFARFRYWDGVDWLEAWDSPGLPAAVEISLGLEALPENELPDATPTEVFRRVVVLPARAPVTDDWASL